MARAGDGAGSSAACSASLSESTWSGVFILSDLCRKKPVNRPDSSSGCADGSLAVQGNVDGGPALALSPPPGRLRRSDVDGGRRLRLLLVLRPVPYHLQNGGGRHMQGRQQQNRQQQAEEEERHHLETASTAASASRPETAPPAFRARPAVQRFFKTPQPFSA